MNDVKSVSLASCALANQYAAMLAEREEAAVRIARLKDETRRRDQRPWPRDHWGALMQQMQEQAQASQDQTGV